ncbi:hypothetical protein BJ878DRAFT_523552 [Calycina marina]|uniref:Heterokaryon incompatibility domain-containing protein n=1 Tax=Calycina marina TaxID=1763456 RepID=A0A9P7YVS8_9HELO|nr:hypothetical protein BJ878DRAFT_523552 [Calycina marina]
MRGLRRKRRVWADAICIDQNNQEKSQQVSLMGSMYKYAHNTIIYLGDSMETIWNFLPRSEVLNSFRSLMTERDMFRKTLSEGSGGHDFAQSLLRVLVTRIGFGVSDARDMLFVHLGTPAHIEGNSEA